MIMDSQMKILFLKNSNLLRFIRADVISSWPMLQLKLVSIRILRAQNKFELVFALLCHEIFRHSPYFLHIFPTRRNEGQRKKCLLHRVGDCFSYLPFALFRGLLVPNLAANGRWSISPFIFQNKSEIFRFLSCICDYSLHFARHFVLKLFC